ncbi:phospholipid/cholesterol/gamma-HCH transport system substrate-binding protein [Mycobacterium sp. OAS707]|nr:phospholipid/cholesterol/gamma-HCH transport system substrate-binding protein [Mycobacterium sp. OAS707]
MKIRLTVFAAIALTAAGIIAFRYIDLPAMLFGVGRYEVTVDLDRAAGLYPQANVSYRGTVVGHVKDVALTDNGVQAVLTLDSKYRIPSQLQAQVHSQSAIGEQYVDLVPDVGSLAPPLRNGDVIAARDTTVPPDIDALLDAASRGLSAIPQDNLKTVIDESHTAVSGLGPEMTRLVKGGSELAIDSDKNLDSLLTLIDESKPVLDAQVDSAQAINAWAGHVASISNQLAVHDSAVTGILQNGGAAADQGRQLFERLQPTLPLLLANLVSLGQVAVTYQPAIEQLLVLAPQAVAAEQGSMVANHNIKSPYKGLYLDFNLNFGLPPACNTGFLPPQQQRTPSDVDYPARPDGDLYCRVPQASPFNVRGARNYPCQTVTGKRAPTVKMCESDQQYVPLNDGYNWKGDPNATMSGQAVPQLPPSSPPAAPEGTSPTPGLAAAEYDPATGRYIGPDGKLYTQSDLSDDASEGKTWQSLLLPPA